MFHWCRGGQARTHAVFVLFVLARQAARVCLRDQRGFSVLDGCILHPSVWGRPRLRSVTFFGGIYLHNARQFMQLAWLDWLASAAGFYHWWVLSCFHHWCCSLLPLWPLCLENRCSWLQDPTAVSVLSCNATCSALPAMPALHGMVSKQLLHGARVLSVADQMLLSKVFSFQHTHRQNSACVCLWLPY